MSTDTITGPNVEEFEFEQEELHQKTSYERVLGELAKNGSSTGDYFREYTDNALAAKRENQTVKVLHSVQEGDKINQYENDTYIVEDNGRGFPKDPNEIKECLALAAKLGNSLNEHGLGAKTSAQSIGHWKYLYTTNENWDFVWQIKNPIYHKNKSFKKVPKDKFVREFEGRGVFDGTSGTRIEIEINNDQFLKDVTSNVPALGFFRLGYNFKLGAIYQIPIEENDLEIWLEKNSQRNKVESLSPTYYDKVSQSRGPTIEKKFSGDGWECFTQLGYLISKEEAEKRGIDLPKRDGKNPYKQGNQSSGFTLIVNRRAIKFGVLEEFGINRNHNRNWITGTIHLSGPKIETTNNKNGLNKNDVFKEMTEAVSHYLKHDSEARDFITQRARIHQNQTQMRMSEREFNKSLFSCIKNEVSELSYLYNDIDSVIRKPTVAGGLEKDIETDTYVIELKRNKVGADEISQLNTYLQVTDKEKEGLIIAPGFKSNAHDLINKLEENVGVRIQTKHKEELPSKVLNPNV